MMAITGQIGWKTLAKALNSTLCLVMSKENAQRSPG